MKLTNGKKGALYLLCTIVLFSTFEVIGKGIAASFNPFHLTFIRFLMGSGVLFAILLVKGDAALPKGNTLKIFLLGFLNVVLAMNLVQVSLTIPGAKASLVALIFSSNPVFVVIFAALFAGERLSARKCFGIVVALTGVTVFFIPSLSAGVRFDVGVLLALTASILFAVYTYLARSVSIAIGSIKMNAWSFLFGCSTLLPLLIVMGGPTPRFEMATLGPLLFLGVFVTGIAYYLYFKGLSLTGAGKGPLVFFFKPALASVFAFAVLGEKPSPTFAFGFALILIGVFAVITDKR